MQLCKYVWQYLTLIYPSINEFINISGKNEICESTSSCFAKEFYSEIPSKLLSTSRDSSLLHSQSDKSVLKQDRKVTSLSTNVDSYTKSESDAGSAGDQSTLINVASEKKTNIQTAEGGLSTSSSFKAVISDTESSKPKSESAVEHTETSSDTFPHDSQPTQTISWCFFRSDFTLKHMYR